MLWIVERYFHFHPEYLDSLKRSSLFWILLSLSFFVYLAWAVSRWFYKNEKEASITVSPFDVAAMLFVLVLVTGGLNHIQSGFGDEISLVRAVWSMAAKTVPLFAALLFLAVVAFGAGSALMRRIRLTFQTRLEEALLCIGLGISAISIALGILGRLGLFIQPFLWSFFILSALVFWRGEKYFVKECLFKRRPVSFPYLSWEPFFIILLFLGISLNLLDLVRPIPTGWDDLGRYMNVPKVLADTGRLPKGNIGWPWALWTALGFGLMKSATLSLYISYSGVLLSCLGLIAFSLRYLSSFRVGIAAAAVFSLMPMAMHQSFADLKLDMGLFFILISATHTFFQWRDQREGKGWLFLSGIYLGVALAVKITSIFALYALFALLALFAAGGWGAAAMLSSEISLSLMLYGSKVPGLSPKFCSGLIWFSAMLALLSVVALFIKRTGGKLITLLRLCLIVCAGMLLALLPWLAKGFEESRSLSPIEMLTGVEERVTVELSKVGIDPSQCSFTGEKEELTRYIGYDEKIGRYLLLPWRMTMNTDVHGYHVDISFLYLALLPAMALMAPFLARKGGTRRPWKWIIVLCAVSWLFWLAYAQGVPWYNLYGFLPLTLLVGGVFVISLRHVILGPVVCTLIAVSLLSTLLLRTDNFGNRASIRYAYGIWNAEQTIDVLLPTHRRVAEVISKNPSTADHPNYVYKIGTFIRYFIPDNLKRIFDDPMLDTFTSIDGARIEDGRLFHWEPKDDNRTLSRLRRLGFKFVIFDLNIATIEQDEEGTLHQKANRFVEFANSSLKVVFNDPSRGIALLEIP